MIIDFAQLFTVFAGVIANLGILFLLATYLDNQTQKKLDAIHVDIKANHYLMLQIIDFHGRLYELQRDNGKTKKET